MNSIVALTPPRYRPVLDRYRIAAGSMLWLFGAQDGVNPSVRPFEVLAEPNLHPVFLAEAVQSVNAVSDGIAALEAPVREAVQNVLKRRAASLVAFVGALQRAHLQTPVELLVVAEEATAFSRAAVAWARARGVPSIHLAPGLDVRSRDRSLGPVLTDRVIAYGERGLRAFADAGVDPARMSLCADPGLLPIVQLARTREELRAAICAEVRWPQDLHLVALSPVVPPLPASLASADAPGRALRMMFSAAAALRKSDPLARFAVIDAAIPATEQQAVLKLAIDAGLAAADIMIVDGDGNRMVAAADAVISIDSARSVEAHLCGAIAVNLWTEASWLAGPAFGANDAVLDLRPGEIAATLAALFADAAMRAEFVGAGRRALTAFGGVPDEQTVDLIASEMLARRRSYPPASVRDAPIDLIMWIGDYTHASAGVRVVHRLAHLVNQVGGDATVIAEKTNPAWNTPRRTWGMTAGTIMLYPEVTDGNPANAKRRIRYVLNVPGKIGGPTRYDDDEMVFYYAPAFLESAQAATSELLTPDRLLPIEVMEPELFYNDRSLRRSYDCVYLGKGIHIWEAGIRPPEIEGAFVIRRDFYPPWPGNREETAYLLRNCRRFYTYDRNTAMFQEAIRCGAEAYSIDENGRVERYPHPDWAFDNLALTYYDLSHVKRFYRLVRERFPS
jgi:hypothetical protein